MILRRLQEAPQNYASIIPRKNCWIPEASLRFRKEHDMEDIVRYFNNINAPFAGV
jgi:hypothetical protein